MIELTHENKMRLRDEVERRDYNIIWCGGFYPVDKQDCYIIFINMDNQPEICKARHEVEILTQGIYRRKEHKWVRLSDNTVMSNVIAWRGIYD